MMRSLHMITLPLKGHYIEIVYTGEEVPYYSTRRRCDFPMSHSKRKVRKGQDVSEINDVKQIFYMTWCSENSHPLSYLTHAQRAAAWDKRWPSRISPLPRNSAVYKRFIYIVSL